MGVNCESIYGTTATLLGPEAGSFSTTELGEMGKPTSIPEWKWRSTTKHNRVYVHLFEWPRGSLHLEKMPRTLTGAYLLADPGHKALKMIQTAQTVDV